MFPRYHRYIKKTVNILCRNNHNITGSQIIYNKLLENDVKDVFMYSGGAIMPLIDCFYNNSINYYIPTNELSLGLSAVGYAKSTGNPGVCIVTSGPGLTNMLTSLTDATLFLFKDFFFLEPPFWYFFLEPFKSFLKPTPDRLNLPPFLFFFVPLIFRLLFVFNELFL